MTSSYDPRLIPYTAQKEGTVLRAYRCPAGAITIGNGFTWGSKIFSEWWLGKYGRELRLGDTISEADSLYMLKTVIDAEYAVPVMKRAAGAAPHAKAAATDMLFNCGLGAQKWTWFGALIRGDIKDSARRMKVTATTAKGRKLPGLVRRRAETAEIMEFNRWPDWVKAPRTMAPKEIKAVMPAWRLGQDDLNQGIAWLIALGFLASADKGDADLVRAAIYKFQTQHPQLTNDGILGTATLDQLQRVIDLKAKSTKGTATASVGAIGGAADQATAATGYGDWILYGSLGVLVIGAAWLAWRYRDEIKIAVRSARPIKGGAA